ncbi:MAG TPA: hypothetical protein VKD71_09420 [Gemmataceae bacterium]|nr:hypothetical protein [Gemmataceae bacterium]
MHPDSTEDLTIRNRRPNRLTVPLLMTGLGCLWATVCGLRVTGQLDRFFHPEIELYSLGIVTCGVFTVAYLHQTVRHWKLGERLIVWPERRYRPAEILEIAFAPDPTEDYEDAATPDRLYEVRAHLRRRSAQRLIVSLADARRVRDWAIRRDIAVSDRAQVLVGDRAKDDTGTTD